MSSSADNEPKPESRRSSIMSAKSAALSTLSRPRSVISSRSNKIADGRRPSSTRTFDPDKQSTQAQSARSGDPEGLFDDGINEYPESIIPSHRDSLASSMQSNAGDEGHVDIVTSDRQWSAIFTGIGALIEMASGIPMVVIGIVRWGECPPQQQLPIWMIVVGGCLVLYGLLHGLSRIALKLQLIQQTERESVECFSFLLNLVMLGVTVGWFIVGWVLVFGMHDTELCDQLLYLYAWWVMLITCFIIFMIAGFIVLFLFALFVIFLCILCVAKEENDPNVQPPLATSDAMARGSTAAETQSTNESEQQDLQHEPPIAKKIVQPDTAES